MRQAYSTIGLSKVMSSVFDVLLKSREIEGIRETLTSGDLVQQLCGLFFRGNHLDEPSGDYTVTKLVEIVLMFVVYHVSKTESRLETSPACGRTNSFKSQAGRSLQYSTVQVLHGQNKVGSDDAPQPYSV